MKAADAMVAPANRPSAGRGLPASAFWLAAAVLAVWFLTLDARHLLPSDEGRYAEIAREMATTGDWVTIRYNGLKYFEKPPLHLWMTAAAFRLFGVGDWQARLWTALASVAGLAITAFAARRWFGQRVATLTALVMIATPAWNIGGHFNALDISVSAMLAGVLGGFLIAQHPEAGPSRRPWMLFAWVAVGLAVLAKGLIGIVLPGLVLVVYSLVSRDWAIWRRLHLALGLVCMLVVAAPWFVLVSLRNPEFAHFFFIHEHWERYTSGVHHRGAPVWYFVPQLALDFLPWIGLWWGIVAMAVADDKSVAFRPRLWLGLWVIVIFAFFSLSGSKLPGYIMPIFPALAVLAALVLDRMIGEPGGRRWRRQLIGMTSIAAIGLVAVPLLARQGGAAAVHVLFERYAVWVAVAMLVGLAGLAAAWVALRRDLPFVSTVVAGLTWFVVATIALVGHETFGRLSAGIDLVPPMKALLTPDMPIYSVRLLDHTLPFYLGRTMTMVEEPDELEFGVRQEPQKWLPTLAAFEAEWLSGRKALAVMSPATRDRLVRDGAVLVPVAADARRVVVANFALPQQ